jgi:hypothetical protein
MGEKGHGGNALKSEIVFDGVWQMDSAGLIDQFVVLSGVQRAGEVINSGKDES